MITSILQLVIHGIVIDLMKRIKMWSQAAPLFEIFRKWRKNMKIDGSSWVIVGEKHPQPQCLCWLCGFRFSIGKWNPQIRADQIHHIQHILDVPKTICLADYQFDFVIGCFNAGIAHSQPYGIQYVFLMALDLPIEFLECRYPAVACPPEPAI